MKTETFTYRFAAAVVCLLAQISWAQAKVTVSRIPTGGMQPQTAVDRRGVVHLIYLKGEPAHCDIFYSKSGDDGANWSDPIKVNSQNGSAIAVGTVRGAHMALGKNSSVHVAWMGSDKATPKAPGKMNPMLYTRLRDDGSGFEEQRNLITSRPGVDGGGSVAADESGNVFVGWHAPESIGAGEQSRQVWISRSTDDGKTFAPEVSISDRKTGSCGCCGMRMAFADGKLLVLYRAAAEMTHRGMYLVQVTPDLQHRQSREIAPMEAGTCIMSTAALASRPGVAVAAWETDGQVQWEAISPDASAHDPGAKVKEGRKHPALSVNEAKQVLLVWAEGTGWNKGGSIHWQGYTTGGMPVPGSDGKAGGLGVWGSPTVFPTRIGDFVILY
jgi:hypothetical protein